MQQGIHTTSYLYARATKAVSLVPPAYYADVVCEQARYWIHGFLNLADSSSAGSESGAPSSSGGGGRGGRGGRGGARGGAPAGGSRQDRMEAQEQRVYDAAQRMWGQGLHENLREVMFYL